MTGLCISVNKLCGFHMCLHPWLNAMIICKVQYCLPFVNEMINLIVWLVWKTVTECNGFTSSDAHTGMPKYCKACCSSGFPILFNILYYAPGTAKASAILFSNVWLNTTIDIKMYHGNFMKITFITVAHCTRDVLAATAKQLRYLVGFLVNRYVHTHQNAVSWMHFPPHKMCKADVFFYILQLPCLFASNLLLFFFPAFSGTLLSFFMNCCDPLSVSEILRLTCTTHLDYRTLQLAGMCIALLQHAHVPEGCNTVLP